MRINSISIKNYRAFKDTQITNIPGLCVLIGANGTGKSTFFDVFGFIKDSMTENVNKAVRLRGGFKELLSRNSTNNISFEFCFADDIFSLKYYIEITNEADHGIVNTESITKIDNLGNPTNIMSLSKGVGTIHIESTNEDINVHLNDSDILGLRAFSQINIYETVSKIASFINDWHLSDIRINSVRTINEYGYAENLSTSGDNLSLVANYLYEKQKDIFNSILDKIKYQIPGIDGISSKITEEGRVLLKFTDGAFRDPFNSKYVSDGTLKLFAYLVLLNEVKHHSILCIEEPENQLYPKILMELAEEFREYSQRGGQVFISTHSPDFLNALEIEEVYYLNKTNGYTDIERIADIELISNLIADGDKIGYLWKQGLIGEFNKL